MNRWHSPPAALYSLVEHTPATILLESASPGNAQPEPFAAPPLTRLFTKPLRICIARRLDELSSLFAEIERAVSSGLYAAGYFTYECGAFFEPTAAPHTNPSPESSPHPLAWFGIYTQPHIFDHHTGTFLRGDPPALARFRSEVQAPSPILHCSLALTEHQHAQRIQEIHAYIRSGDVYQVNFTLPIHVRAPGSSAALYGLMRSRQPAPYAAFLHTQANRRILSCSPELFFHVQSPGDTRRITTRPMKGTAPRGRTTAEDRILADWLRTDPKNRSENVMIVDLLRNDLGRLCDFGTVRVSYLFAVERYPTLWQMTSTVQGELRPDVDFKQIFRALFPCGSITGAPKIRAMQLIGQLEQQPRGVYTGAIGFFSKQETVFNVAIRTLALDGDQGTMGVGSGIVIDSNPAAEWAECLLKASFLASPANTPAHSAPESFSLIESLLWQGGYPLLELHLDRLEDSAGYFDFPFNRAAIKAALESHAATLPTKLRAPSSPLFSAESVGDPPASPPQPTRTPANSPLPNEFPHKVRLLLHPDGSLHITSEPIPAPTTEPLRVRIDPQRIDPQDPRYFHKTTRRPLYAQALQAAIGAGYDEAIFLNQRGEVTEAANHNIFIRKAGRLLTPPIACGLLPGVHRRHILVTDPNAEERILTLQDLQSADAVYLSNAVRGLRQAIIHWDPA